MLQELFSFKGFTTKTTNTHLEHLEDSIILKGDKGGKEAISFLQSLKKMFSGGSSSRLNVTVKWDGAPAIICGINPENNRFFVGTKSVFNVNPKLNYTPADIRKNHGGGLADKLLIALRELPKLGIKGVIQGDFLFSKSDLKQETINGERFVTFTPNTITYAVQASSNIGKRILKARMGIVFHTLYQGKTIKDMKASFGRISGLPRSSSVFVTDAVYKDASGSATFTSAESKQYDAILRMAEGSLSKAGTFLKDLITTDPLSVGFRLKTYFNFYIKSAPADFGRVKQHVDMFREYFNNIIQDEIDKKKTQSGKSRYIQAQKNGLQYIDRNKQNLYFAIATYISLQRAKDFLLRKVNQAQSIGHFIRTENGFRVTNPEGYVAVDKVKGAVKLVDRLEFSKANFTIAKDWVKG